MKQTRLLAILFAIAASVPAFAGVVDDAIALASRGVSDDVIAAWAEGKGGEAISVDDIVRMKDAKVPQGVIAMIIRQQNRAPAIAAAPAPAQRYSRADNYADEAQPEQRETRYVERPSASYATPAVYAPAVYASPAYYSDYYYSYPYYSSYYPYYRPYRGYCYPSYGLSFSFGSHYHGGHSYGGYGSHYYGSYGSGYRGSYGGYHGGSYGGSSGYRGGTGYSSRR
jgi:hypothetical protein